MTLKRFSQSATRPAALALLAASLCAPSAWPLSRPATGTSQTFALTSSSNVPAAKDRLANLGAFDQATATGRMKRARPMARSLEIEGLPLLADGGSMSATEQELQLIQEAMQKLEQIIMEMMLTLARG
jgi:hypothetical protein